MILSLRQTPVNPSGWLFKCPACSAHIIPDDKEWKWDGDMYLPSITPQILININLPSSKRYRHEMPTTICNFEVVAGVIRFHDTCNHKFAGKLHRMTGYTPAEIKWMAEAGKLK